MRNKFNIGWKSSKRHTNKFISATANMTGDCIMKIQFLRAKNYAIIICGYISGQCSNIKYMNSAMSSLDPINNFLHPITIFVQRLLAQYNLYRSSTPLNIVIPGLVSDLVHRFTQVYRCAISE